MQQQYLLSPHVHVCLTDDHAVLLDLRRDKYIGIGPNQTRALASLVRGWPVPAAVDTVDASIATNNGAVTRMLKDGLLTADGATGKEAHPATLPRPEDVLVEADLDSRPRPGAGQTLSLLRACITARLLLKRRPIESVVNRVQKRKSGVGQAAPDFGRARGLVDSFLYLRPLLFGARDECLYDSLALVEFLACYDLYPTWVFGVQTRPFLAHSWVQEGATIFNDTPDYVRRFTPILAI